jgi:hypothetical protein
MAEAFQLALRLGDAGDAGALMAEQKLGVGPALALCSHAVFERHPHLVEKHFVEVVLAVD